MKEAWTYEKKLEKDFLIQSIVMIVIVFGIIVGVFQTNKYVNKIKKENVESELKSKTELFKSLIYRQIDADIQTLLTLSSFDFGSLFDEEDFVNGLNESNKVNKFIRMSFVKPTGTVYHATLNEDLKVDKLSELNPNVQSIIQNSFNGENGVSRIHYDQDLQRNVVAISVPVKKDSKNYGVLIAYDDIETYNELLKLNTNKELYINIINDEGKLLSTAKSELAGEEDESIFLKGMNILDKKEVQIALQNKEDYSTAFKVRGNSYGVYLSPMKYNNWYMYSITDASVDNLDVYVMNSAGILYYLIAIVVAVYCFYLLKKNIKLAYYDSLTNAYNINKFSGLCKRKMNSNSKGCIGILNVNKFQVINETFGEVSGDKLLCHISDILSQNIYEGEYYCRYNADQFVFYFKTDQKDTILARLEDIQSGISRFYKEEKSNFDMRVSFGICVINDNHYTYKNVVKNAYWALKAAKKSGELYVFFDERLSATINLENEIESSKFDALYNEEFRLFLQPKFNFHTGKLIGSEALVRWIKQDGRIIYPDQFIPLFEKNAFCIELDFYMVEKVCQQLHDWMKKGLEVHPISINQSKLLFYRTDYVERLCEITSRYEIPHSLIVLEILEGLAVENIKMMNETIRKLQLEGFKVSLDDFGSGYSSLNSLNELIVDEIKIDKMFLMNIKERKDTNHINILNQIIGLIKSMNIPVIIEGIEEQLHIDILKKFNCSFGQGYYFSKPVPSLEFEQNFLK